MQYANSLIGQQFKTITQVNVFHVYNLVDGTRYLLTKVVGELAALLWMPEIRNIDEYLICLNCCIALVFTTDCFQVDVEVATANVLNLFAAIDPSKMTSKLKLHLIHIYKQISFVSDLLLESQWRLLSALMLFLGSA
jgi:hypothetical protein